MPCLRIHTRIDHVGRGVSEEQRNDEIAAEVAAAKWIFYDERNRGRRRNVIWYQNAQGRNETESLRMNEWWIYKWNEGTLFPQGAALACQRGLPDVQRSPLFCANIVKKDTGRARWNNLATAGTNFTKPGAQSKGVLCTLATTLGTKKTITAPLHKHKTIKEAKNWWNNQQEFQGRWEDDEMK